MARQARVISIDALTTMQAALARFERDLRAALDDLEMEVRRALEWIQHDAPQYWEHEVRMGWERVSEARVQLQQAMTMRRVAEHDPSCVEEKKALEKARRRLQLAQEKAEAVRQWRHAVEKAVNDYLAARGQMTGWLEADLPQARTALKHMLAALETYVAIETPADVQGPPPGVEAASAQQQTSTAATESTHGTVATAQAVQSVAQAAQNTAGQKPQDTAGQPPQENVGESDTQGRAAIEKETLPGQLPTDGGSEESRL